LVNFSSTLNFPGIESPNFGFQQSILWTGFNATGDSTSFGQIFIGDPSGTLDLGTTKYLSLELIDSFTLRPDQVINVDGFTSINAATPAPSSLVMLFGFLVTVAAVGLYRRRLNLKAA